LLRKISFHQKKPEKMHHGFLKKPNMHIKMIFEGSCDTED